MYPGSKTCRQHKGSVENTQKVSLSSLVIGRNAFTTASLSGLAQESDWREVRDCAVTSIRGEIMLGLFVVIWSEGVDGLGGGGRDGGSAGV